jgi:TctA family transporter
MVLGPLLEQHFMVSAIKANWDTGAFIERPIALFLMSLTFLIIGAGLYFRRRSRQNPNSS